MSRRGSVSTLDVAKTYFDCSFNVLLLPSTPAGAYRLLVIGRKRLPTPATGKSGRVEVLWGEVTSVGENLSELRTTLGANSYETSTRGEF